MQTPAASPVISFVGAGRVARTIAPALAAAGWPVAAVASRSRASAEALAATVPGCVACPDPQQAVDAATLVFLTVPDDRIASTCAGLQWRSGQAVVHCGGATEVAALAAAAAQGAVTGGFHPLQLFADPVLAARHMDGCTVAVEAPPGLDATLRRLAASVGYRVIALPPGGRALYHAACCHSAPFLLSLLREACDLWNALGVSDADALAALLPLARGTLASAAEQGLAGALAGPFSRGDVQVVGRHTAALAARGEESLALYRAVALRQIRLARERGALDAETLSRLQQECEGRSQM